MRLVLALRRYEKLCLSLPHYAIIGRQ